MYSKLGDRCNPKTIALTNNDKVFLPLDPIYWKDWVPVNTLTGEKKIPIRSHKNRLVKLKN